MFNLLNSFIEQLDKIQPPVFLQWFEHHAIFSCIILSILFWILFIPFFGRFLERGDNQWLINRHKEKYK